jgi:hypothetical protein
MPIINQPGYFTVNGKRFYFGSTEVNFGVPGFAIPTLGLQSLDYSEELVPGELRGTSPVILGDTTGKYSTEWKMKLPKAETGFLVQQIANVAAANPDPITGLVMGYGQWKWTFTVNYLDIGQALQTDVAFNCRIKKIADSGKVGGDPLYCDIDLWVQAMSHNGYFMVDPQTVGVAFMGNG